VPLKYRLNYKIANEISAFAYSNKHFPLFSSVNEFHTHIGHRKDPESKAEKVVNLLKDNKIVETDTSPDKNNLEKQILLDKPRLTLWGRIVKEVKHYYNGFKLLFLETKIAIRLMYQVLKGHTLTRRERRQVI
jgi:hypothetical protein